MKRKKTNLNRFILKLLMILLFLIGLNFWSEAAKLF